MKFSHLLQQKPVYQIKALPNLISNLKFGILITIKHHFPQNIKALHVIRISSFMASNDDVKIFMENLFN